MTLYLFLLTLVLAAVASAAVLVAIWAGQSRRHWFWRAFAVWLCIAAMLPIRAYEPAMVFGLGLPLVGLAVWTIAAIERRKAARQEGSSLPFAYRFTLRDTLLATAILGMVLGIVVEIPRGMARQPNWLHAKTAAEILLPAAAVALVGLFAWRTAIGKHRLIAVFCLTAIVGGFAWAMWPRCQWLYLLADELNEYNLFSLLPNSDKERLGFITTLTGLCEFAATVGTMTFLSSVSASSAVARRTLQALVALIAVGLAIVYWRTTQPMPFPPSEIVSPNHFGQIMQIATRVKEINGGSVAAEDVEEDDPAAAGELRDLYPELLLLLALSSTKSVDLSSNEERQARERSDSESYTLARVLWRWLIAEAKAARSRGDLPTAVDCADGAIQFGAAFRRNGLLIDDLVGGAAISGGYRELYAIRRDVDSQSAARAVALLCELDSRGESMETIVLRDMAYCERVYGWQGSFSDPIARLTEGSRPIQWKHYAPYAIAADNWRTILRLLKIELAIRAFQVEHQKLPSSLVQLVPEFLPVEPLDPFSGRSFIYRPMGDDEFTLYGVGRDTQDNGGHFADLFTHQNGRSSGYDIDLETLVRRNPLLTPP